MMQLLVGCIKLKQNPYDSMSSTVHRGMSYMHFSKGLVLWKRQYISKGGRQYIFYSLFLSVIVIYNKF